jgi:hypothetical protein
MGIGRTYELSSGGGVTKIGSQGRGEDREGVNGHEGGVEHDCRDPDLPVQESIHDKSSLVLVTASIVIEEKSSL